jgi:hypothetical protein
MHIALERTHLYMYTFLLIATHTHARTCVHTDPRRYFSLSPARACTLHLSLPLSLDTVRHSACVCAVHRVARSRVCVQTGAVRALVALRRPAVFIARQRRTRVRFALAIGRPPICYAGVTWTSRTTSAPWVGRAYHTSVIDAAGAIYVIGGFDGTYLQDVWVSTDEGANRTRVGGYTRRVLAGTRGVLSW